MFDIRNTTNNEVKTGQSKAEAVAYLRGEKVVSENENLASPDSAVYENMWRERIVVEYVGSEDADTALRELTSAVLAG